MVMTLKDKLRQNLTGHLSNDKTEVDINIAAKIADDYAIEFTEWCDDNYFRSGKGSSNWVASLGWYDDENFTTSELLKIFEKEKEKGL
jgi:hypothetical protein